uniref:MSP domain-containing protein n=1 Tax=Mesocestoides corti TaxID=53468 RepID=A0A5K3F2V5_MESCO
MAGSRKSQLKIEPSNELDFFGPFTTVQPSIINLTNPTDNRITFKVKTTVPKRYCVRPSCGIVEPSETVNVAVMLQPFDCDGAEKNKHKFMIQSMVLEDENTENLEQIWKEANPSQISDTRLKCTLRLPDDLLKCEPEELVFEGPASESSTCVLSVRNTSPKDVVFKVKTNAPKRYVVTPNEGIIKAHETQMIKVATVAGVDSAGESRDRIALLSVLAPDDLPASISDIWHTVDKAKISEKFLACNFPNQEQGIAPNQSNKLAQLTQEIEKLRKENEELKHHQAVMNRLGRETSAPAPVPAASGPMDAFRMNIPPILYLLVTFLFALAVGKFIL